MARIALVTSSYLPRIGGVEEHVRQVARRLARAGHSVAIWSVDQGDAVPAGDGDISVRYLPCPLPSRSVPGALRFAARAPSARRAWRTALRRDRPELLHVHCFGPNGVYAAHFAGDLPLVYSHHGETFMDSVFDESALLRRSLARTLTRADVVTSCSSFAGRDLERFGLPAARVQVVPNGVQLDEPEGELPDSLATAAPYLLGVGRLVEVKGFDQLIRAFALLVQRGADGGLDVAIGGGGPELPRLRHLADGLGLGRRVRFLGPLARPQVGAVMAGARALVVPSRIEAFGITVLEGWRAGVPVIATANGGPGELISDGVDGLLVDSGSVPAIAAALERVIAQADLAAALGERGSASVLGYTWDGTASAYDAIYARIARDGRVSSCRRGR